MLGLPFIQARLLTLQSKEGTKRKITEETEGDKLVESFFILPMETIPEENIEEINDVDNDIEISSDNEMEIEE